MPANVGIDYIKAEKRFHEANTLDEKITALEEMIRFLPKHKGTENIHAQLKQRLSKLLKLSKTKKRRKAFESIEKKGLQESV